MMENIISEIMQQLYKMKGANEFAKELKWELSSFDTVKVSDVNDIIDKILIKKGITDIDEQEHSKGESN